MKSQELKRLAVQFLNLSFGSLWWGREDLIQTNAWGWVQNKKRKCHPLLSVMTSSVECRDLCTVPMFPGSTVKRDARDVSVDLVVVKDLLQNNSEHLTVFGATCAPVAMALEDFLYYDSSKADTELVGDFQDIRKLWPNLAKPRLDHEEMENLKRFYALHFSDQAIISGK